ncbi:uncharacterized protein L3040_000596 [Drepanopeziza brunnea f. sp. 'multigermtubi']|nr:hypothetical protein L3040_000596 [Drepanopeziza brunnea f. sp. 'multigermtubi']
MKAARTASEAGWSGATAVETIPGLSRASRGEIESVDRAKPTREEDVFDAQGFRYRVPPEVTRRASERLPIQDKHQQQQAPKLKRGGTGLGLGLKRLVGGIGFGSKREKEREKEIPAYRDLNSRQPETAAEAQARARWEEHQRRAGLIPGLLSPRTSGEQGRGKEHGYVEAKEEDQSPMSRPAHSTKAPLDRVSSPTHDGQTVARAHTFSHDRTARQENYVYTPPPSASSSTAPYRAGTFPKDQAQIHEHNRDSDYSHRHHQSYSSIQSQGSRADIADRRNLYGGGRIRGKTTTTTGYDGANRAGMGGGRSVRDVETSTVNTTPSEVLPRVMLVDFGKQGGGGQLARDNEQARDRQENGLGTRPGVSRVQTRGRVDGSSLPEDGTRPGAVGDGRARHMLTARESDTERRARELKAADVHLARVRDGRGHIDCTNRREQ